MRMFLGIELPNIVKENIYKFLKDNAFFQYDFLTFVKKENLHITISFLGEQQENLIDELNFITELRKKHFLNNTRFLVFDYGIFPNYKKPRIIWIGIMDKKNIFSNFTNDVEKILVKKKIIKDPTYNYTPHITVARNKKGKRINLKYLGEISFGNLIVDYITLFSSTLTPNGPIYNILRRY